MEKLEVEQNNWRTQKDGTIALGSDWKSKDVIIIRFKDTVIIRRVDSDGL